MKRRRKKRGDDQPELNLDDDHAIPPILARSTDPISSHEAAPKSKDIRKFGIDSHSGRMLIAYMNAGERGLTVEEAADIAWPEPGPKHESHTKRASDLLRADYIEVVMVWDDKQGKLVAGHKEESEIPGKSRDQANYPARRSRPRAFDEDGVDVKNGERQANDNNVWILSTDRHTEEQLPCVTACIRSRHETSSRVS